MNVLWNFFLKKACQSQRRELENMLQELSGNTDEDVGFLMAMATHQRHILERQGIKIIGDNLNKSDYLKALLEIGSLIKALQRQGDYISAAGLMVWIHTARVLMDLDGLRDLGIELWQHLQRGFPYVELQKETNVLLMDKNLDVTGFDELPLFMKK